jgi:hypothetical protein
VRNSFLTISHSCSHQSWHVFNWKIFSFHMFFFDRYILHMNEWKFSGDISSGYCCNLLLDQHWWFFIIVEFLPFSFENQKEMSKKIVKNCSRCLWYATFTRVNFRSFIIVFDHNKRAITKLWRLLHNTASIEIIEKCFAYGGNKLSFLLHFIADQQNWLTPIRFFFRW